MSHQRMACLSVSVVVVVSAIAACRGPAFSPGLGVAFVNATTMQVSFASSEGAGSVPGGEMTSLEPCTSRAIAFGYDTTNVVLVLNGSHRDTFTLVVGSYSASRTAEAWDTIMIEASGTTLLAGAEWPDTKTPCTPPPTPVGQASATS